MIDQLASFFESAAHDLGVAVRIPRPGGRLRTASIVANSIASAGLVAAGTVTSSKVLIGIGALGLAGVAVLIADRRRP